MLQATHTDANMDADTVDQEAKARNLAPDVESFTPSPGGVQVATYRWDVTQGPVKGVVHIVHGLAEHALRYGYTARALNRAGYAVFAHDHRGHGGTDTGTYGYFADEGGWQAVVDDLQRVQRRIAEAMPSAKRVVLAHSMGSFACQAFMATYGQMVDAVVLSATGGGNRWLTRVGISAARLARRQVGPRGTSRALEFLAVGNFNLRFYPARTGYDWLSRDPEQVDRYVQDPLCGNLMPTQSWLDIFTGMTQVQDRALQAQVPKGLPVYLMAGDRDPVGDNGRGVRWLERRYREVGLSRVEHRLYAGARHEILNETNRDEVIGDLVAWLDRTL